MKIPDPVAIHALRNPTGLAIIAGDRVLTWSELDGTINGVVSALESAGVVARERVAFVEADGMVETIVRLWAVLRIGAIAVPLSGRLPLATVGSFVQESRCRYFVRTRQGAEIPGCTTVQTTAGMGHPSRGYISFEKDSHATICRTSGSTALPKGAVHTIGNHFFNAWASNERVSLLPGDRWLLSIPLNHVGGLAIVFRCFIAGATVVTQSSKTIGRDIDERKVTHISLVSTQLLRLLKSGVHDCHTLKSVLCGGSAMPVSLVQRAVGVGLPVQLTYGMTEASSQVSTTDVLSPDDDFASSGKPLRHVAVRIEEGEILLRGETVFAGYAQNEDVIPAARPDGWFPTGDMGEITEGVLHVYGRKDSMFISGGENVKPEEIEFFLSSNNKVERSVIVPILDNEFGYRPVAFIQGTSDVNYVDLALELATVLPRFKVPVRFYDMPAEYQDISKIDRNKLKEIAELKVASEK